MKRLFLVIGCWLIALVCINAQSLEQKKICALKWTLQQTFYNKSEGQQIAHLNVCDFKSFSEFQKNKLISSAVNKVSDKTDLNRIKNIVTATAESDILSYVPTGGRNEYKADLEKIKTQSSPATNEEVDDEVVEEKPAAQTPEIKTVEEAQNEEETETEDAVDEEKDADNVIVDGVSFLTVILTCIGVYVLLSLCTMLFIRSRKRGQKQEEMVSMEQYRAERLRLMERIKSLEIEVENVKSLKRESSASKPNTSAVAPKTAAPQTPVQAPAVKTEPKTEPKVETAAPVIIPATQPNLFATQTDPVEVGDIQPARPKFSAVMFYPVPVDGMFINGSSEIEPGLSLYMLKTSDDQNATFQILNTPEAIGSALVAMSDMVKPACKVLNNVAAPVEILAEKLGTAKREGDGWRIITKAEVRLI